MNQLRIQATAIAFASLFAGEAAAQASLGRAPLGLGRVPVVHVPSLALGVPAAALGQTAGPALPSLAGLGAPAVSLPGAVVPAAPWSGPISAAIDVPGANPVHGFLHRAVERIETSREPGRELNALFDAGQAHAARPLGEDKLKALNDAVVDILRPFNNAVTDARLQFTRIGFNDKRATQLGVELDYGKRGSKNELRLKALPVDYAYPETPGALPQARANIAIGLDLLKLLKQEEINQLGPGADRLIVEYLEQYRREYGDAATLSAEITRKDTDAQGNLTALGLSLGFAIDLSNLPKGKKAENERITAGKVDAQITLKGVSIDASVTLNPNSREFRADQPGLKEALEILLARDPETMEGVRGFIAGLDQAAGQLVEYERTGE
ncbi:MAG: hypothetical protein HY554_14510 [Elusimicrobia bacterium]|nr:hypothetical protein [Elusimicrobiota bacterium]